MNKFEQLIEYVINDEEQKARELFHDIVVAKSRQIYEDIMSEEEVDEGQAVDIDEESEELDEAADEDLEEGMGGDAADDLIDDVEAEEQDDVSMEAEGDDEDMGMDDMGGDDMGGDDMGGDEDLEDRVMDLEDKLDELMAEFEGLMGGDDMGSDMGDGDDFGADEGGDAIDMDDTEEMMPMAEAISLKAAPKPVTSEEGSVNKKSNVAANAGAKGPVGNTVKPVHTGGEMGGHHDAAPYKNTTKDIIGKVGNTPAQGTQKPSPATKPKLSQETGVNNRSIVPGQRG
jgi:hypothetical protein